MSAFRDYLKQNSALKQEFMLKFGKAKVEPEYKYSCIDDFIERNGKEFYPKPLTLEEWKYLKEVFVRSDRRYQKRKQCFINAQMHVIDYDFESRMLYTEGYVLAIIPIIHGWLNFNGKVVDVTLRHPDVPIKRKLFKGYADRALGDWNGPYQYLERKLLRACFKRSARCGI